MNREKYFLIGDIHGCYEEFLELIEGIEPDREIVSVGDLVDRGPASEKVLQYFVDNKLKFVMGNHEDKFLRYLNGNKVKVAHGLAQTIEQLDAHPRKDELIASLKSMKIPHYLSFDHGNLIVVHGAYIVAPDGHVSRNKALYGATTGQTDEHGYIVRLDWAEGYNGLQTVVHGHVPVSEPRVKNNVYNIDTACVFGNKLTGLYYPEMTFKHVQAKKDYAPHRDLG